LERDVVLSERIFPGIRTPFQMKMGIFIPTYDLLSG